MNEWCFHGTASRRIVRNLSYRPAILYHVTNTTDMDFSRDEDIWISHMTNTTDTPKYQARWSSQMPIIMFVLEVRVQYTINWYIDAVVDICIMLLSVLQYNYVNTLLLFYCTSMVHVYMPLVLPQLFNTAVTRAREWLIVVGEPITLCTVGSNRLCWLEFIWRCHQLSMLIILRRSWNLNS